MEREAIQGVQKQKSVTVRDRDLQFSAKVVELAKLFSTELLVTPKITTCSQEWEGRVRIK